jgi:hypothetical protein
MPSQTEIHPHTIQLVSEWRGDLVVFSDTFGEGAVGLGQGSLPPEWWKTRDPDAVIATRFGNTGSIGGSLEFPTGLTGGEDFGLWMLDDRNLLREQHAKRIEGHPFAQKLPSAQAFVERLRQPIVAIANNAPRGGKNPAGGRNGEPYHLAVTESGMLVFASRLKALAYLAMANRIQSLYEVRKLNNVYGPEQQFRSSVVAQTLFSMDTDLVPVYQYGSVAEKEEAIENGEHTEKIPKAEHKKIANVDKFGNGIVLDDLSILNAMRLTGFGTIIVTDQGQRHVERVRLVTDLDAAQEGELVVYQNPSDGVVQTQGLGLYELVVKVPDPNTSTDTTMHRLVRAIPGFNHLRAQLELAA